MTDNPDEVAMTFWEHLAELRMRLIKATLAFLLGASIAWYFKRQLLRLLANPFIEAWNEGQLGEQASLHFPAPATMFIAYIKLAILGGLVLALPIILYQLWAFIAPGLYSKEKRLAIPFVASSCLLFAGGGYFGWRFAFPVAFQYLLSFSEAGGIEGLGVEPTIMISDYIEFVTRMLLAFGIVFELPVVVFFLSIAGLINHTHMIKFGRYFIVIAFVLGAIITPPDPTSQAMLAIPLCLLYGLSIGIAYVFGKKPAAAT